MASDNFFSIFLPFLFIGKWTIQYPVKGITFMDEKSSLNMMNKLRVCNKKKCYIVIGHCTTLEKISFGFCHWHVSSIVYVNEKFKCDKRYSNWIKICILKLNCWRKLLPRWKYNLSRFFKGLVSLVTRYFQILLNFRPSGPNWKKDDVYIDILFLIQTLFEVLVVHTEGRAL